MEATSGEIGPRSAGKLLDLAFNIYFKNIGTLFFTALVVVVPLTLVLIGLDLIAYSETDQLRGAATYEIGDEVRLIDESRFFLIAGLEQVLAFVAYLLVVGAAYRAASEAYLGRGAEVGPSIRFAGKRLHSILWVTVLVGIATAVGLLALIIGAIFVAIALIVAVPVLMFEDLRGTKALRRSFRLVQDNWWRTFGVIVVTAIFASVATFIAGIVQELADPVADDQFGLYVVIIDTIQGVVTALTAPLTAVAAIVIYYDLRIRKEGFDVELLARGEDPSQALPAAPETGEAGDRLEPPPPPPPPPSGEGSPAS